MLSSLMFSILPGLREISSGIVVIILTVVISLAAAILFPVCGDKKEKKEVVGCEI